MASSSKVKNIMEEHSNLSMNDEDIEGLILEDIPENTLNDGYSMCVVGSLLTDRKVNFAAMRDTFSSIWRPIKGVFVEETSVPNLFLFKFFHELGLQRVLDDRPWTFNNQALVVKKLEIGEQLTEIKLNGLYIWVQVYDLPMGFNSEFILQSVGNFVGKFVVSDPKNFQGVWRNYVRIKVVVNVNKPLKSQMRIKKAGANRCGLNSNMSGCHHFIFIVGSSGILRSSARKCLIRKDSMDPENMMVP
ncbi:uncharacterized protein LOC141704580 [Apium graveolens]|uniref:uncharacterized protein LOC141704580 n=1 Tax=Apium graveolens TaxID=4045 RepID=UPI003D7A55E4